MLDLFDLCTHQYSQKVAVDCQGETLTYQQLQLRIARLANYLYACGVKTNTPVGLCLDRGLDALIGLLAVLTLKAIYIPVDPTYPRERIAFMLSETRPALILTHSHIAANLPSHSNFICIDADKVAIEHCKPFNLRVEEPSGALAYVMYTSGSTGKPKGVEMPRTSVELYLAAISEILAIQSEDIYLHTASFSFSSSVRQLLVPLSHGATVVLASQGEVKNPLSLLKLIKAKGITISDTVASVWRSALQAVKALDTGKRDELLTNALRLVLLSGDLSTCNTFQQIRHSLPSRPDIVNIYGQTETIGVCASRVPGDFTQTEGSIPVGFPYKHSRVYILDEMMQPVPTGEVGELYISGGCLAKGYLNRPDLTNQRFLINPWNESSSLENSALFNRLYKTGDLARQLPDGSLEIKGRTDFQVKLRGMRVELGEIENALEACAIAKEAVVLAKEDARGDKRLVAYVLPQPEYRKMHPQELDRKLKQHLQQSLADYLIPTLVVKLEMMPLTPNGKRNRLALPEPDWSLLSTYQYVSTPADPVEVTLQKVWAELLGFMPGIEDSFFDLGGHSLMAVQLFARLESEFNCNLSFNHLLQCPTIQSLASLIKLGYRPNKSTILVTLKPQGAKPPLFCIHGIGGAAFYYRAMLPYLPEDQPVYGVQSRGFDKVESPLRRVEEMAALYLEEIRNIYPKGPLYLIGHSFGGLIAYEMACQIQRRGETPGLLLLVDTKTPELAKTPPPISRFLKTVGLNLWNMPHCQRREYIQSSVQWFFRKRKVLGDREYAEALKRKQAHIPMLNVLEPNYQAQEIYTPAPYQGDVVIFRARIQSPRSAHDQTLGWGKLVDGRIKVHILDGAHMSVMEEPYVQGLARALNIYLGSPEKIVELVLLSEKTGQVA